MGLIEILIIGIVLVLIAAIIVYYFSIYNKFQSLKNASQATLNQIRVAIRKRLDLISQLADSVRSYAKFEREVLEKITSLRSMIGTSSPSDLNKIDREARGIIERLFAVVEAYPDLKTSQAVNQLMQSIREVEDEIARHRYTYNNIVQQYNTMIDTFPSNIIARMNGFTKLDYLEVGVGPLGERPKIEF